MSFKNICKTLFVFTILYQGQLKAQSDSLSLFRSPTKLPNSTSVFSPHNALSVSLVHFVRGGTMITYERLINRTPLSVFVGVGFSRKDFLGQYSLDDDKLYYNDYYSLNKGADLGGMYDVGIKFYSDNELGGSYWSIGLTRITNLVRREFASEYLIANNGPSKYSLNYTSNDLKFVYGFSNDVDTRFYSDFYIGTGFRFFSYQELEIDELPAPITNSYSYQRLLSVNKRSNSDSSLWLFLGWRLGAKF